MMCFRNNYPTITYLNQNLFMRPLMLELMLKKHLQLQCVYSILSVTSDLLLVPSTLHSTPVGKWALGLHC